MSEASPIRGGGLWLLMLCPAIAVSDTVVNAIGFSAVLLATAPLAAVLFLGMQRWLDSDLETPAALLTLAGVLACVELLLRAYFHDVYSAIALFLPLAAVNCVIAAALTVTRTNRAEALANVLKVTGGVAAILLVLGAARELVGRGSILHAADDAFGAWAGALEAKVFSVDMGFLLGMLPPGAFIALGLLIALRNWVLARKEQGTKRPGC